MRGERFLLHAKDVVREARCRELAEQTNSVGFEMATVSTPSGPQSLSMIRNNSRAEWTDGDLATEMWPVVRELLTASDESGSCPIGLSHRWKAYRYLPGERFNAHRDGTVRTAEGLESRLTVLFLLKKPTRGGGTLFYADRGPNDSRRGAVAREVVGDVGDAIVFDHKWWHEGQRVVAGEKLVLRTDVLYETTDRELS